MLYTAVWNGILKSTDNGVSWQNFATGLPYAAYDSVFGDGVNLYTAPGFPVGGDNVQAHGPWYAAAENGSTSWGPYNSQTPCTNGVCNGPVQLALDAVEGTIYSANWGAGVWRLNTGVAPVPLGTPAPMATSTPTSKPTNTPVATATNTPLSNPTNTPVATATPTRQPAQGNYTTRARVSPNKVMPGSTVSITANVTSTTASSALVDVEVYDPSGAKVFQKVWDGQSFTAGQTLIFTTRWSVPPMSLAGSYTVKIGVFSTGWGVLYDWNDHAATFTVK